MNAMVIQTHETRKYCQLPLLELQDLTQSGHCREQLLRVFLLGCCENSGRIALLDDLALMHDRYGVTHVLDDRKIMADEQIAGAGLQLNPV